MIRKNQRQTKEQCLQLLQKGTSGVLSLKGENYPYSIPLSYALLDESIVFHTATAGEKLIHLQNNAAATFCVIVEDVIEPHKFTTLYRSVIVSGHVEIVKNLVERKEAMKAIVHKYAPEEPSDQMVEMGVEHVEILRLSIDQITGKIAKGYVKE